MKRKGLEVAIRNNSFSGDKDGDRFERLQSLAANIDTYAAELGGTSALFFPSTGSENKRGC